MNRNVSIVVVLLVLVVIAGYLVWLRSRYQPPVSPQPVASPEVTVTPPTATPGAKEATTPARQKTSTPSSTGR